MKKETKIEKPSKADKIAKKEQRQKDRKIFLEKKAEMKKLLKEANKIYVDGLKSNKIKNINETKQIQTEFANNLNKIKIDVKISSDEKTRLIREAKIKFSESIEFQKSMVLNRKLAVSSEYKISLAKIEKTYMNDVIKRSFSFHFKRLFFGLNKEFSRTTWWSRKHVFLDFAIILIIVGILALIFFAIDTAYIQA